eukprot:snap_masked-scaffold_1-processed-gene-8.16-mRNA-1 protein AED:1.00 eAED:1.00 QI:0/-1/0/0/-1/1/1/0/201
MIKRLLTNSTKNLIVNKEVGYLIKRDVISKKEEKSLLNFVLDEEGVDISLQRFRLRDYEYDHWDRAIAGYKEFQRPTELWKEDCQNIIIKIEREILSTCLEVNLPRPKMFLPPHLIDLAADGEIYPHVDSVKHSGQLICGVSLLSARKMILSNESGKKIASFELFPRSLYILFHDGRFKYSHSVPVDEASKRRLALLFRDP